MSTAWEQVQRRVADLDAMRGAIATLQWDQQTYMPRGGGANRGEQLAILSAIAHQRATDPQLGDLLQQAHEEADDPMVQTATAKLIEDFERDTCLPEDLVTRFARAETAGFDAWIQAKQDDDFAHFAPHLRSLLELSREKAAAIDSSRHPLQVLMDSFDPGVQIEDLKPMFARLQAGLGELIEATVGADLPPLGGHWDAGVQRKLHDDLARKLGYDFAHGRMDAAEHPFTVSLGHGDVRITTHLYEDDFLNGLGSTVHEAGHALYEQGLPASLAGTGLDQAASFGMHESQSRFWENAIGRSLPFMEWLHPQLAQHFPDWKGTAYDLYRAANRVEPGLIRVAADEVTYNLHVIVRFELELALFDGDLSVAELPAAWNDRYERYLGVVPPNDALGVLQDVHWSGGSFAYFQSYTLGNLYAASLDATLREHHPELDDMIRSGEFAPILTWLRDHIHQHGRTLPGAERIDAVVGDRDHVDDLLGYLWARHGALAGHTRPH